MAGEGLVGRRRPVVRPLLVGHAPEENGVLGGEQLGQVGRHVGVEFELPPLGRLGDTVQGDEQVGNDLAHGHAPVSVAGSSVRISVRTGSLLTQDGDRAEAAGDLDALVDVLLAPLAPELYQHQRHGGRSVTEITAAFTDLAQAVLGRGNGGAGRGPSR